MWRSLIAAAILTYKVTNDKTRVAIYLSDLVSFQRMIDEILQDLLQIGSSNALTRECGTYLIQLSTWGKQPRASDASI